MELVAGSKVTGDKIFQFCIKWYETTNTESICLLYLHLSIKIMTVGKEGITNDLSTAIRIFTN